MFHRYRFLIFISIVTLCHFYGSIFSRYVGGGFKRFICCSSISHETSHGTWRFSHLFLCEFIQFVAFLSQQQQQRLKKQRRIFFLKGAINWCKDTLLSPYTYILTSYEPPAAVNLGRSLNTGLVVFKGGQSDEAI